MSFLKVWIHFVFSTKNREPFLTKEIRQQVIKHIRENAREKEIWLDHIGGWNEHLHCLISMGKEQSIAKVAQLIKGESSHWINEKNLTSQKFQWQDDYFAVSVSESQLEKLRAYIRNQEQHHKSHSYEEEVEKFNEKYGWNGTKKV